MSNSRISGLIFGLLALIGVGMLIHAWYASRHVEVIVEWSTASELDTAGFNLYRSENSRLGYLLVNKNLIPSSSDPMVGGKYSFHDVGVAGHTYYYLLEDVSVNGTTNRNGPIIVNADGGVWIEFFLAGLTLVLALIGLVKSLVKQVQKIPQR